MQQFQPKDFKIEVKLIYSIILVSGVQHSNSIFLQPVGFGENFPSCLLMLINHSFNLTSSRPFPSLTSYMKWKLEIQNWKL